MSAAFQPTAFQNTAFQTNAVVPLTNWALAANGGVATASSCFDVTKYSPTFANNGYRTGRQWGLVGGPDSGWNDANSNIWTDDWLQIDFAGTKTIDTINVFTCPNAPFPSAPTPDLATIADQYGITAFDVQYWDGSTFVTVPGGSVTGNNKVWRQFIFSPITTAKIRVKVNNGAQYSRIVELEAWGGGSAVTPWSGTSRGRSLAGISRGRMLN